MSNGRIQPQVVERLDQIGDWLRRNGEAIYGTRGGPVPPQSWAVMTQEANKLYVHIVPRQNPIRSESNLSWAGRFWGVSHELNQKPCAGGHFLRVAAFEPTPESLGGATLRVDVFTRRRRIYGCAELLTRIRLPDRNDDEGPRDASARLCDPSLWCGFYNWVFPSPTRDVYGLHGNSEHNQRADASDAARSGG